MRFIGLILLIALSACGESRQETIDKLETAAWEMRERCREQREFAAAINSYTGKKSVEDLSGSACESAKNLKAMAQDIRAKASR